MKLETRYSTHPEDSKYYTTEEIRDHYLIDEVFAADEASFVYSHNDRIIAGGIMPVNGGVKLGAGKKLGTEFFFQRREGGIINVGGAGKVKLDGEVFDMNPEDGLYIGMGTKDVEFMSVDGENPAKFYFNSAPAHHGYPTRIITLEEAKKVHLEQHRKSQQENHQPVCASRCCGELSAGHGHDEAGRRQRMEHHGPVTPMREEWKCTSTSTSMKTTRSSI